jgi:hypothetical protein
VQSGKYVPKFPINVQQIPPKTPVSTKQHGVNSKKTVMFKIAARRTSKLTSGWFSLLELKIH